MAAMAEAEATGNRICVEAILSKKTGMEVSTMMCIKDSLQKVRWWTVVKLAPVALFLLWTFGFTWGPIG